MIECKNLPPSVYKEAWHTLYSCFGERMQHEEMNLMDSVLSGVTIDMDDEIQRLRDAGISYIYPGKEILGRFLYLDRRKD